VAGNLPCLEVSAYNFMLARHREHLYSTLSKQQYQTRSTISTNRSAIAVSSFPLPAPDFRHVLAIPFDILLMFDKFVIELLSGMQE
jgi:hypothetical protein